MNKSEFEEYLKSIGGLNRTYREYKGPIVEAGWFQLNEGWYDMLKNLINELIALGWNKRINQAKEKFGGLRFYVDNQDLPEGGREIINKYEAMSIHICEKCGKEGTLRKSKWIITACDDHSNGAEPMDLTKF